MERHVSGDASSWAHFLFLHSIQAFGRASLECMRGHALFFMHARRSPRRFCAESECSALGSHADACCRGEFVGRDALLGVQDAWERKKLSQR